MQRYFAIILDFIRQTAVAIAATVAALTDPLRWPQAFGFMSEYHWVIPTHWRQAIFAAVAFLWMFGWYCWTRIKYEDRHRFELSIETLMLGGEVTTDRPGEQLYSAVPIIVVRNTGALPSILSPWLVLVRLASGDEIPLRIFHITDEIRFNTRHGIGLTYAPDDAIYQKLSTPLSPGDLETGFIIAVSPDVRVRDVSEGDAIVVRCRDILGRSYEAVRDVGEQRDQDEILHYPRLKSQRVTGAHR